MSIARRVVATALLVLPVAAQNLKLNGPLAHGPGGSIGFPSSSPDGRTLVYAADRDGGPESELYALAASGKGGPVRLSGALRTEAYPQFTQDGQGVLFLNDSDGNGSSELFLAPLDGTAPPRALGGPPVAVGYGQLYYTSSDGNHVLYLTNTDEVFELFSVPFAGGAAMKLSGALVPGGNVQYFVISGDGRWVLYSADQDADEVVELFVAPVDGSSPARKLPIPLVPGGDVATFQLAPGATHVLYTADQEEDERFELFTVPADGSQPPRKLNGPLVPGGDVGVSYGGFIYSYFYLSLDGRWVVYSADQDTDERFELYSVPADGSLAAAKLSTPSDHEPALYGLSHDSAWAIYQSDPSGTDTYELFSVPIDGSAAARRISGPMVSGGDAYFPAVTYDSRRVVYVADQDMDQVFELYSAPIDGSAPPVKLNAPMPPGGDVAVEPVNLLTGFYVMEDGVVYEADQEVDNRVEIYFAPIAGGAPPHKLVSAPHRQAYPAYASTSSLPREDFDRVYFLRGRALYSIGIEPGAQSILLDEAMSMVTVGDVGNFLLSASGERAVYLAQQQGGGLFSVRTDKPSSRVRLRSGLGFPSAQLFTADERRVIYLETDAAQGTSGLYSEPVDGSAPPVRLDVPPARNALGGVGGDFDALVLLPDGDRLAFLASLELVPTRTGLFVAPVDGSSPPQLLSGDLGAWSGLEVSADGSRIVFRSVGAGLTPGLFVVPSDGSALPRRVDAGGRQSPEFDFRISPDGTSVFYRTSAVSGPSAVFMAPSDASAPPLRLSAALQSRGEVTRFAVDPLGRRVVYFADQEFDGRFELFSVPADGSSAPVRLHAPLTAGLVLKDFQLTAHTARVVFSGWLRANSGLELFSAPLDASRPPVRISADLASGGNVLDYQVSPDGQRVVYRADQAVDGLYELFSASVWSGRGQAKLSRPLVPGGNVGSYRISADSRTVAFTAQRLVITPSDPGHPGGNDPPLTLLRAPIRGEEKASEIAGPFHGNGTVRDFQISANGTVVYRADQDEQDAIELYAAAGVPRPTGPLVFKR